VTKTLSLFWVLDNIPLNMVTSLEIETCVEFCMINKKDGHNFFVHFGYFKPLLQFWFYTFELSIAIWFIQVLATNLLKFYGICAFTIDVEYGIWSD
jgi:hypothetical protein